MANTRSATLSIRLKPEIKRRLAKLAATSGRSSNFLISDAVESYVADQERMLAEIRHADCRRRRNSEESPLSGPRWGPTRNSRVSHRWFALYRPLSCARHAEHDWHHLAHSSNQVSSSAQI